MDYIRKKLNNKYILIVLLVLILLCGIVPYLLYRKQLNTYTITDAKMYHYISGIKYDLDGHIKIYNDSDKHLTELYFDDYVVEIGTIPFYYSKIKKVLFPKQMSLIRPIKGTQNKINYFSYVDLDEYSSSHINGDNKAIYDAFMYDGNNLFFFLEEMTIKYGKIEKKLSPMSYIIYDYKTKYLEIYNYVSDESIVIEEVTDPVIIYNEDYSINASFDLFEIGDDSKLLIKKISSLKNY